MKPLTLTTRARWLALILLALIFALGAYLRLVGPDWDEEQHLHPDERFLTMVESSIEPVKGLGEYFDTGQSSLNPHNRGHGFFVYGTLPIFIVRYVAEWLGQTGYGQVYLVGRTLSALADLLVLLLVFLLAERLYDWRTGLLAAAFYAFAVLPIQQSHFFTVDTFTNLFALATFYVAVGVAQGRTADEGPRTAGSGPLSTIYTHPLFRPSLLFGLLLGMAAASKINAVAIAVVLPGAAMLYWLRLDADERERQLGVITLLVVLGGVVSFLSFRVFQPYAFSGPGFFGIKPNPLWVENMRSVRAQAGGDVDFPPALQWARRPVWFSWQNLTLWGLGLPLGLLVWASFLWMGWRVLKGEWQRHALLWGWTAFYFTWQSLQWNSTMRYQLLIYPLLAVIAAWGVVTLMDGGRRTEDRGRLSAVCRRFRQPAALTLAALILLTTFAWAFAFTRIYTRPHTRVEASRWMMQNFPGPITLRIENPDGGYNQPLPFPEGLTLRADTPYQTTFIAFASGTLRQVQLPHVANIATRGSLLVTVSLADPAATPLSVVTVDSSALPAALTEAGDFVVEPDTPPLLETGATYWLHFEALGGLSEVDLCAPLRLQVQTESGLFEQMIPNPPDCVVRAGAPLDWPFTPQASGALIAIAPQRALARTRFSGEAQTLTLTLTPMADSAAAVSATVRDDFLPGGDLRGSEYILSLDTPLELRQGESYSLRLEVAGDGELALAGAALANESSWDDGLPLRMDGYDPYGGIYQGGLNFEMYWDDNEEKLARFTSTLAQADYVLITSSRQWGSTTRVPERYPLTSTYYRHLLGCPVEKSIEWCYNVAQPGMFQGDLGFELIRVFQSNPTLGRWQINDQFAEEAFTVYDHPKVFVFQKTADYDPARVAYILGAVDLSKVVHVTPRQADSNPANLMLPEDRLAEQRAGGTWSELFNPAALHNRNQFLGVMLWYLTITALGLLAYPLVRFALPGLDDRGYPLARIVGLLLLAYLSWLAGSARIPVTRLTIAAAFGMIAVLGVGLAWHQRDELRTEWQQKRDYFLTVEGLFLLFFLVFLLIRLGNPDLWHPWKGGEKPMDFSYFNAVLKSTSFPPYDPWFAGGYINYYYYGFVLVGMPVKLLGIVPAFAYNLILPTLFAMVALGAFSIVWNLGGQWFADGGQQTAVSRLLSSVSQRRFLSALAASLGMAVLGNLGILRMLVQGYQRLAATPDQLAEGWFFRKLFWTVAGLFKAFGGARLPYRLDEWYWNPSRIIGAEHGNPITEFPFFTFLYADLHAHMIAMPVALLVIAWALAVVLGRAWARPGGRSPWQVAAGMLLGGLAIGAMYPINLSDIYTYLPLGVLALGYAVWRYGVDEEDTGARWHRLACVVGAVVALVVLSNGLYQPYRHWYSQGYSEVDLWPGTHTPTSDYLAHWGLFLFVILSWMTYETIDWMAKTPVSALRKLEPYRHWIWGGLLSLGVVIFSLGVALPRESYDEKLLPLGSGVHIIWFVLPLAVWVGILLLRPDQSDAKRFILFLTGTALMLTLTVEIVYVVGDIGRMNTVFKFYLQAWSFFAVSAAAALGWLLQPLARWRSNGRLIWQITFLFLVASAGLYPLMAGFAKISDRMAEEAPRTLDGMAYMQYATYADEGAELNLAEDYAAIRWMQDNVVGSPVIVEANQVEYRWGTRYTIYTGLPGVVGWNWHQRQQRTITPHAWVYERVDGVHEFYQTEDIEWARDFLRRYDVRYIILGQLERAKYAGPGLEKFAAYEGQLWREVFRTGETVIYEVIDSGQ